MNDVLEEVAERLIPAPTEWSFRTSGAVEVMVQTEVAEIGVGASWTTLYLQHSNGSQHNIQLVGIKVAAGVGIASPISPAYSSQDLPGSGIGRIYRNTAKVGRSLELHHFNGGYLIYSAEKAGLGHGISASLVFFGIPRMFMSPPMVGFGIPFCNGVGLLWGLSLQLSVAGLNVAGLMGNGLVWE